MLNQCAKIYESECYEDKDYKSENKPKQTLCFGLVCCGLFFLLDGIFEELFFTLLVYLSEIVVVAHYALISIFDKYSKKNRLALYLKLV